MYSKLTFKANCDHIEHHELHSFLTGIFDRTDTVLWRNMKLLQMSARLAHTRRCGLIHYSGIRPKFQPVNGSRLQHLVSRKEHECRFLRNVNEVLYWS